MEFKNYVRTPFTIKALEVTEDNFDEVAAFCGKSIETTANGDRYIFVNRRIIPTGSKIFVGWWITLMDDNVRCYPPRSFSSQFVPMNGKVEFTLEADDSEPVDVLPTPSIDRALSALDEVAKANRDIIDILENDPSRGLTTNSPIDLEVDED